MQFYIKHLLTFLKAAAISLLFGASWAITFYKLDEIAVDHLHNYRSDFFLEIIIFFFSGLVGAFLFFVLIRCIEFVASSVYSKS
ncbi:hypothetical protein [Kordia jejudonensis]|uniref:hypothetical protein n=1 Tax=Kordia jejudonensis TaxID=1348245 RepID=UPI000629461C|nr:hypothetical protein [Kordia jejudonensis]